MENKKNLEEQQDIQGAPVAIDYEARKTRDLFQEDVIGETGGAYVIAASIAAIFVAVIAFLIWASIAKVNETAISLGEIIPAQKLHAVQHLEGGIVAEILVDEGQFIEKNQPIIKLDPAGVQSELEQMRSRKASLTLYVERLNRFSGTKDSQKNVEGFNELQSANTEVLKSQVKSRESQISVLQEQIVQKKRELDTNRQQIKNSTRQIELLQEEETAQLPLMKKGVTPKVVYLDVLRELEEARGEKKRLESVTRTIEASIVELERRIEELKDRLTEGALSERGRALAELSEVDEVIKSLEDRINRLMVRSPAKGIVKQLFIKTVRGVLAPGGVVAEVLPLDEKLLVESRILTTDIGFIEVGQAVQIKVQTYDFTRYGILQGKVDSISATTFLDEKGNPYYKARITLETNYLGKPPNTYPIMPGMTVQADIITGRKTVLDYLLKPIYVVTKEGFRER